MLFNELKTEIRHPTIKTPSLPNKNVFSVTRESGSKYNTYPKGDSWNLKESAKYAAFVLKNEKIMEGKPISKLWDIFKKMGDFVGTRNFRQCKSYHQQQFSQFKNITKIIENFKESSQQFELLLSLEINRFDSSESSKINLEFEQSSCTTQMEIWNSKAVKYNLPKTSDEYQETNEMCSTKQLLSNSLNMMGADKKKEWIECHQLFIEWTSRLKELMSDCPQL